MSKQVVSAPAGYTSTDESYRAWGLPISTLMNDAGLTKTSDTGQIDWSTVLKPTSTNILVGYEIRKLANAILGDLYFRIEYRTSSGSMGGNSFLRISVGSGTDGAGNLTGTIHGDPTFDTLGGGSTSRTSTANYLSYCFVDDGTFALALNPANTNSVNYYNDLFIFARTSDIDGVYNNNGAMILQNTGSSAQTRFNYWSKELEYLASYSASYANPVCFPYPYHDSQPSCEYSTNKGVVAVIEHLTPTINWHKNVVAFNAADAPAGAEMTATVLGATHTYVSLGITHVGIFGGPNGNNSNNKGALALLWD